MLVVLAGALLLPSATLADGPDRVGAALYERLCTVCHGVTGRGDGPAVHLFTRRPRDLTRGAFKWRSTASGEPALLSDIERTIAVGVAGTSMPAFRGSLTRAQIADLARHVRSLSPRLSSAARGRRFGRPALPPADVTRGRAVWERARCGDCHGPGGRGDGPAAPQLRDDTGLRSDTYDLTRAPSRGGTSIDDIVRGLWTGLDGTPMPSYEDSLGLGEMADVAAFVRSLMTEEAWGIRADGASDGRLPASFGRGTPVPPPPRDLRAIGLERELWYFPLRRQGIPPRHLTPAEASLDPARCGRCHERQYADWRTSIHARAMGPGFFSQVHAGHESYFACRDCHAPLAEQSNVDSVSTREGVTCAGCHLRDWERQGPPRVDPRRIVPANYPLTVLARYERSDFCLPCHQQDLFMTVNGKPLLDTFREFMASPYFRRGFTCQSCHMPERAHTWRGAHDPEAVRQGLEIDAQVCRDGRGAVATVRLTNAGAGHMLPSTPTPAAFLRIVLLDENDEPIADTERTVVFGREIGGRGSDRIERHDTRLAPGETRRVEWRTDASGAGVRIEIEWRPDWHYERLYRSRLALRPEEPAASEYREALRLALTSPFTVYERVFSLEQACSRSVVRE